MLKHHFLSVFLQVACMQFINIVVHSVEDMNFRVHLQFDFTKLGLDDYLDVSPHHFHRFSERIYRKQPILLFGQKRTAAPAAACAVNRRSCLITLLPSLCWFSRNSSTQRVISCRSRSRPTWIMSLMWEPFWRTQRPKTLPWSGWRSWRRTCHM